MDTCTRPPPPPPRTHTHTRTHKSPPTPTTPQQALCYYAVLELLPLILANLLVASKQGGLLEAPLLMCCGTSVSCCTVTCTRYCPVSCCAQCLCCLDEGRERNRREAEAALTGGGGGAFGGHGHGGSGGGGGATNRTSLLGDTTSRLEDRTHALFNFNFRIPLSDLQVGGRIGSGGFSVVYYAKWKGVTEVAVKVRIYVDWPVRLCCPPTRSPVRCLAAMRRTSS